MPESTSAIYLVAGATRGVGLALVADIATRYPSAITYAGARDPVNGASQLIQLANKYPGRVEIVKYVAADKESNDAVAKVIREKHGRVDAVIANAAIPCSGTVYDTPSDKFAEVFSINVLGPVVLFQSVRHLLKASAHPRFVPITSAGGSMAMLRSGSIDTAGYGASKAALNWVTRKIHFEEEWLVAYPQCPGAVDTDMAGEIIFTGQNAAFEEFFRNTMRTPDVAAGMVVDILLASTREKDGGGIPQRGRGQAPVVTGRSSIS